MRRKSFVVAVALLGGTVGCSLLVNLDTLVGVDGGSDATAPDVVEEKVFAPDAATTCAWDAPFTNVHALAGLAATKSAAPQLRRDELVIYYQLQDIQDAQAHYDIVQATRADRSAAFGAPIPLTTLNQAGANSTNPSVRSDELLVVFSTNRLRLSDPGATDLFVARRSSVGAAFDAPVLVSQLGLVAPTGSPFLTGDGKELWFSATLDGGAPTTYLAPVLDGGFQAATPRSDIAGWVATLSDDKRTVYFSAGTNSLTNAVRVAHRQGVLDPFSAASLVNEVNLAGETPGWLSPDQCRLYFSTRRSGGVDIYVAERTP